MAFGPVKPVGFDVKELTGTTPANQGERLTISDIGVDKSRVVSISSSVDYSGIGETSMPHEFSAEPGHQYSVWINEDGLNLQLHSTNSGSITNKPFVILVIHS